MQIGRYSIGRVPGAVPAGLATLSVFTFACVEQGRSVDLPPGDVAVAFTIEHDESTVFRIERWSMNADADQRVRSIRPGAVLSVLTFSRDGLLSKHVATDPSRLSEVELGLVSPELACEAQTEPDGLAVRLRALDGGQAWRLGDEATVGLVPTTLPLEILGQLVLRLPLRACGSGFGTRPFARDGQLLDSPFFLDGWHEASSAAREDIDVFSLVDAVYLDSESALVLLQHGLIFLRRGARVESTEVPEYFSRASFPNYGLERPWALRSIAVRPAAGSAPLRILVAGTRNSSIPLEFESLAALLSFEDSRFEILSSTVALGKVGLSILDAEGRLLVPLSESQTNHRRRIIFANPDDPVQPFELVTHTQEIKRVASTFSTDTPHAVLTRGGSRLQIGHLRSQRFIFDEDLPFGPSTVSRSGHSLAAFRDGPQTTVVVGGESGELAVRPEGGAWQVLERHFDPSFRQSVCSSAMDACGGLESPPELAALSVLAGAEGRRWFLSLPDLCPHALATAEDGCTSIVEIDKPFVVDDSRALTVISPAGDGRVALVGGRGGLLVELLH